MYCFVRILHIYTIVYKPTRLLKSSFEIGIFPFGFSKFHSTNHANILLVDNINNALDSGNVLIVVFLYLKKECWYCEPQTSRS